MGLFERSRSEKKKREPQQPAPNNPLLFSTYTPSPNKTDRVVATPESILILLKLVDAIATNSNRSYRHVFL